MTDGAAPPTSQVDLIERSTGLLVLWSDLNRGQYPSADDIVAQLRGFGVMRLLGELSRIMFVLERQGRVSPSERIHPQYEALVGLLGAERAEHLQARVTAIRASQGESTNRDVYFHPRQVLTVMKLVLLELEDVDVKGPEDRSAIVDALLMANDLIERGVESMRPSTDEGHRLAAPWEFAQVMFNLQSARDPAAHARALHWFIEPQQLPSERELFDIAAGLSRATGLAPIDVYTALYSIYADWLTRSRDRFAEGLVSHNRETFFAGLSGLDATTRGRWYDLATVTLETLRHRVRERYSKDLLPFDFLVFERSPLVSYGDHVICLSPTMLNQMCTASLYHQFLRKDVFSSQEISNFQTVLGPVIERYVIAGIRRMADERCLSENDLKTLVDEDGRKLCDAVVRVGSSAIVFEVKSARALLAARQGRSYDALLESWEKPVKRAMHQFSSLASDIRSDRFGSVGLGASEIKRIYPVLVTVDQVASVHTYRAIRRAFIESSPLAPMIRDGLVQLPCLFSVRDIEWLEAFVGQGRSMVGIIHSLSSFPGGDTALLMAWAQHLRDNGFHVYSRWHRAEFSRLINMVSDRVRALGLGHEERAVTPASD